MPLSRHLLLFPILLKWAFRSSCLWAFIIHHIVIEWERERFPLRYVYIVHFHQISVSISVSESPSPSFWFLITATIMVMNSWSSCAPLALYPKEQLLPSTSLSSTLSSTSSPESSSSPHHHHHVVIINTINIIFLSSSSSCLSASLQPSLLNGSRLSRSRAGVELPAANMKHESTNISRQGGIDLSIGIIAQNFCKNSHHGFCITSKRINMEKMIKSDWNLVLVKI